MTMTSKAGSDSDPSIAIGSPVRRTDSLGKFAPVRRPETALRVVSPLPGSVYYLDPDLPQSDRLPLKSNASGPLLWESATLQCDGKCAA